MLVVFPDGTSVMAHGRLDVVPPDRERPPDVALYLDERWTTDPEVKWPYTFVRWADFDVPDDEGELFHALCEALQRAKAGDLVEIACDGGTGRTGTALACLAILTGVEPESAASWVRSNYHPYAVEVPEQEALIGRFVEWAERSTQALWDPARAPGWHQALEPEFGEPYWEDLEQFISEERCRYNVFPPTDDVFAAFHLTPLSETTVVIVGQDPYPTSGQAHGLCFSVRCGARVPRSLVNIKRELQDDLGMPTPRHGNLETWARRGVLLLNATLTVREGEPRSHRGRGWERFTDRVIEAAAARTSTVFILWGAEAQEKAGLIGGPSTSIITSAHPSPQSAHRGFFGSRPFSRANEALALAGLAEIDWALGKG